MTLGQRRLLKLAAFLERLEPKNFDLSVLTDCSLQKLLSVKRNPKKHTCGAAACAIGYIPAVFPKLVKWNKYADVVKRTDEYTQNFELAKELFEIPDKYYNHFTKNDSYYLFESSAYHPSKRGPKSVARRIRSFVKNNGKHTQKNYAVA